MRDAFRAGFDDGTEVGASVAVWIDGRCVVDLHGGFADRARTRPWTPQTVVNVYSTTKAVVAFLAATLVDEGAIDLDLPVSRYWPQFAEHGKEHITVRQVLSHQSGVPAPGEPVVTEDLYDWNHMVEVLQRTRPVFVPGSATAYQARVYGFLVGEVIRRVSGYTVGGLLRRRLADPLQADFMIGVPENDDHRCAKIIAPVAETDTVDEVPANFSQPLLAVLGPGVRSGGKPLPPQAVRDMMHHVFTNPANDPEAPNDPRWRRAEIPSSNGHSNARGIARMFAPLALGGALDGRRYLRRATLRDVTALCTTRLDLTLGFPVRWASGFTLNSGEFGPNPATFGHRGIGGAMGFADPDAHISFGYAMNQMVAMFGEAPGNDPRTDRLVAALYESL